jgi:hypothetical protein
MPMLNFIRKNRTIVYRTFYAPGVIPVCGGMLCIFVCMYKGQDRRRFHLGTVQERDLVRLLFLVGINWKFYVAPASKDV